MLTCDLLADKLDEISQSLPDNYEDRKAAIDSSFATFRLWAAQNIEQSLTEKSQSLPQDTYEDRKKLATWINGEARSLGLTIVCPKTGLPCLVHATPAGGKINVGSFKFETADGHGKRNYLCMRTTMPDIKLTLAELHSKSSDISRGRGA